MVRSLLIKLGMLVVTLGSLLWIGSVTPIRQVAPQHIQPAVAAPLSAVPRQSATGPSTMSAPPEAVGMASEMSISQGAPSGTSSEALPSSDHSKAQSPDPSRRVDLNRATASDLEALPGIGPRLAQRVIEHRTSHGPFKKVEDLRNVKGIGHKKFDRLRSHVLVTHVKASSCPKGTP